MIRVLWGGSKGKHLYMQGAEMVSTAQRLVWTVELRGPVLVTFTCPVLEMKEESCIFNKPPKWFQHADSGCFELR